MRTNDKQAARNTIQYTSVFIQSLVLNGRRLLINIQHTTHTYNIIIHVNRYIKRID